MYTGYNKIPSSSSEWKILNLKKINCWYVTEKVHGSCFCFIYDVITNKINFGKRKGILQENETFFNYKSMLPTINDKIILICNIVKQKYNNVIEIHIFGELFGGTGKNSVQNGIFYSNDIAFYAFDISYINDKLEEIYLDFEEQLKIFSNVGILYAKPLGKFNKLEQGSCDLFTKS